MSTETIILSPKFWHMSLKDAVILAMIIKSVSDVILAQVYGDSCHGNCYSAGFLVAYCNFASYRFPFFTFFCAFYQNIVTFLI